jgi:hypothetical protein
MLVSTDFEKLNNQLNQFNRRSQPGTISIHSFYLIAA